jgi:hypothetical protein
MERRGGSTRGPEPSQGGSRGAEQVEVSVNRSVVSIECGKRGCAISPRVAVAVMGSLDVSTGVGGRAREEGRGEVDGGEGWALMLYCDASCKGLGPDRKRESLC